MIREASVAGASTASQGGTSSPPTSLSPCRTPRALSKQCASRTNNRTPSSAASDMSDKEQKSTQEGSRGTPSIYESEVSSDKEETSSQEEGESSKVDCKATVEKESEEESEEEKEASEAEDYECLDIPVLLKLRHSIDPLEGYDERLEAVEISADDPLIKVLQVEEPPPRKPASSTHRKPTGARNDTRRKTTSEKTSSDKKDDLGDKFGEARRRTVADSNDTREEGSKKLVVSDNSWQAQQRARRASTGQAEGEVASDADVVRSMKSILNKLTIEKFVPLYQKLVSCGIQTTAQLEALIHEVFDKATTQHHFINMYADLCALLHTHFSENPITDDPKMTFKKILLNGCQAFFERHLRPPELEKFSAKDREELTIKYKMQMLGNINFVGALLVRQMLASKVMFAIMEELLTNPTSETLESLACLLTVVGPKFDTAEWQARPILNDIFHRVKVLTTTSSVCCRVRCLLKDLLELRANGWKDRKPIKTEKPSTLKEVADKAAKETGNITVSPKGRPNHTTTDNTASKGRAASSKTAAPAEGYQRINSLAGLKATREPQSPKSPAATEGYQRINSLAGLRKPAAQKESGEVERPRKNPSEDCFDQEACRKGVSGILTELRISHEVKEAVVLISALKVPAAQQASELCNLLTHMAEEGSEVMRKLGFELVAGLFADGHWKPVALNKGLSDFTGDICVDLKCDVPNLPKIMQKEMRPAFRALVDSGMLQSEQYEALSVEF